MAPRRAAHQPPDSGGPLDGEVVPELRFAADGDERPQQRVMANHGLLPDLGTRVDDRPGADDHAGPDYRVCSRTGVDVPDGVPLLGPADDGVLLQPCAVPDPGAAADHRERADLAAVPEFDRAGRTLGIGGNEHRQRTDPAALTGPQ